MPIFYPIRESTGHSPNQFWRKLNASLCLFVNDNNEQNHPVMSSLRSTNKTTVKLHLRRKRRKIKSNCRCWLLCRWWQNASNKCSVLSCLPASHLNLPFLSVLLLRSNAATVGFRFRPPSARLGMCPRTACHYCDYYCYYSYWYSNGAGQAIQVIMSGVSAWHYSPAGADWSSCCATCRSCLMALNVQDGHAGCRLTQPVD